MLQKICICIKSISIITAFRMNIDKVLNGPALSDCPLNDIHRLVMQHLSLTIKASSVLSSTYLAIYACSPLYGPPLF